MVIAELHNVEVAVRGQPPEANINGLARLHDAGLLRHRAAAVHDKDHLGAFDRRELELGHQTQHHRLRSKVGALLPHGNRLEEVVRDQSQHHVLIQAGTLDPSAPPPSCHLALDYEGGVRRRLDPKSSRAADVPLNRRRERGFRTRGAARKAREGPAPPRRRRRIPRRHMRRYGEAQRVLLNGQLLAVAQRNNHLFVGPYVA
mmetsp:Transcript_75804/g.234642  ORF Transcript_75804/g.234642 Transcript_75804/m.234642 type:complete len:202 (-) Transcript_75804:373-978(-)